MANAFFNFSISDSRLVKKQIEVLAHKYDKHRNNPDRLEAERKVRAYVMYAIAGFKYQPGQKLSEHPAASVLNRMIGFLDYAGYVIKVNHERTQITIYSSRNTYVTKEMIQDTNQYPQCISGGVVGAIQQGIWEERNGITH
jgi:hypothetical protein